MASKVAAHGVVDAAGALAAMPGTDVPPVVGTPTPTPTPPPPLGNAGNLGARPRQPAPTSQPPLYQPIRANLLPADGLEGGGRGYNDPPGGDPDFATRRTQPVNRTGQGGVTLGSRNFNWAQPLVHLPGRAGLDLDLTLYYNSLLWTRQDNGIEYNADRGTPAAGFRLGFPVVQRRYINGQTGQYAFLLLTPSGGRVELSATGTANVYEARDGSYMQLIDTNGNGGNDGAVVLTADGTRLSFEAPINNQLHCTEVKDRNGNFLTISYNAGRLNSIVDTLGRVINFEYAGDNNLAAIKQTWNGATHTWATFAYGSVLVQPNFPGLAVYGANNTNVTVLTGVGLGDGSYYQFSYETNWGIANRISKYGPGERQLNYTFYNIPPTSTAQSDSPRFTEQHVWAVDWNNGAEAVTTYTVDPNGEWSQQALPDGTIYSELYATSGWATGLPVRTEVWSGGQMKKWTTTEWTQDNTGLSYQQNPRPFETNIYDAENNRRRTTISYTSYNLPFEVTEYAADAVTPLRRTQTYYRFDSVYIDRRLIGLPSQRLLYDGSGVLVSKVAYDFDHPDWGGFMQATVQAPTQHDEASYNSNFILGRGNLVYVGRFDVNAPDDWAKVTATTIGYNQMGQPAFTRDALGHQTNYDYGDNFADGNQSRHTFAYPTGVGDADGNWAYAQYRYDFGAVTATVTPPPVGYNQGPTLVYQYDPVGRPQQVQNLTSGAYTRYEYDVDWGHTRAYSSIESGQGESYQNTITDGAGHVYLLVPSHAGSAGGYRVERMEYDALGRLRAQSHMTETDSGGTPAGDDAASGYVWTYQSYDWQGRPTVTMNADGTQREVSYGGCGCAGGAVTTVRDERGRGKRYTKDALGRLSQVEELNWDTSVYATTNYYYNARAQLLYSEQGGQWRGFGYDGYGRLSAQDTPEQGHTAYNYHADGTMQTVTDARGATTTFSYNNRRLVTGITYGVAAGVAATPNVTFTYDAAGNRTSLSSGVQLAQYHYNLLSQLDWEEVNFAGLGPAWYRLSYEYNLAGEVTQVTNPWGAQVGYTYDTDGRTTNVTGAGYAGVTSYASNMQHRAFDGLKGLTFGNSHPEWGATHERTLGLSYDNRQRLTEWHAGYVLGWHYDYNNFNENTGRVTFARSSTDATLNRSYDYDQVGRLWEAHSGNEADAHISGQPFPAQPNGAYSHSYRYDVWGNMTTRVGWGGWDGAYLNWGQTYTNNRHDWMQYDAAGHMVNDGGQYTYNATGQQTNATYPPSWQGYTLQQSYDGDGQRSKKVDNGTTWYYLRSSVLGGQVVCDLNYWGGWHRGYVYLGGQLLAIQSAGSVQWVAQDPVTKSQRLTDVQGNIISGIDMDPWGGETARSWSSAWQPHKYTSYERDGNSNDQAGARTYHGFWMRFDQPDPFDGSADLSEPQSFNRYAYVQNDPVNAVDPSGQTAEATGGCSAMYSSCAGSGGGGYSGTPFDSGSFLMGGYNDLPEHIAEGLARHNSIISTGYDPALGIFRGQVEVTTILNGVTSTQILGNPTPAQLFLTVSAMTGGLRTNVQDAQAITWSVWVIGGAGAAVNIEWVAPVAVIGAVVYGLYLLDQSGPPIIHTPNAALNINGNILAKGGRQNIANEWNDRARAAVGNSIEAQRGWLKEQYDKATGADKQKIKKAQKAIGGRRSGGGG